MSFKLSQPAFFFPSNAFMASARSLHTFNRGKQVNCSLHAGLSICRKPQKCRLWTSTQSRKLSQQENKQESKPKTTKQKQQKTHNQNKNQTKTTEMGSQPAMGITCMMASYVSFCEWPKTRKQNRTNPKHTKGPHWWVIEATKLHTETRDPPSQDPRDHKEQPFRHDIHPGTSKQTPTTPESETRSKVK